MPIGLLRLIPVLGSAAVLAAVFPASSPKLDLDNTEELFPVLEPIQPVSQTVAPRRGNGRGTVTGVGYSQGVGGGDGVCKIYTGKIGSMGIDTLEFENNLQKYNTLEGAKTASKGDGTVQCDSKRHFYVGGNQYLDKWEIRSSNSEPTQT